MRYSIDCEVCGPCECVRSMEAKGPYICPECGRVARRVYASDDVTVNIPQRFLNGVTKAEVYE